MTRTKASGSLVQVGAQTLDRAVIERRFAAVCDSVLNQCDAAIEVTRYAPVDLGCTSTFSPVSLEPLSRCDVARRVLTAISHDSDPIASRQPEHDDNQAHDGNDPQQMHGESKPSE